mmetsp:Transcript_54445/g.127108  ORF Transcript_54445/g.127108 Transcript_54445/m.127108 type:complete len:98 (-) Transcript_54445:8-301(-)
MYTESCFCISISPCSAISSLSSESASLSTGAECGVLWIKACAVGLSPDKSMGMLLIEAPLRVLASAAMAIFLVSYATSPVLQPSILYTSPHEPICAY